MAAITYLFDSEEFDTETAEWDRHLAEIGEHFNVSRETVNSYHPMPPPLVADAVVVQFTASWAKLPFLTLLQAQQSHRPLLLVETVYCESFERLCVPNQQRFRMLLKLVYSLVDVVVCVSEAQAKWMRDSGVVPARKITVIPWVSKYPALLDIAAPCADQTRPLRLLAMGPHCRQAGFETLIEAMRLVPPEIATLELAATGDDWQDLEAIAAALSHVHVGNMLEDRAALLAACDAVVVPSRWGTFGLVAAHARSAARPIIVCDPEGQSAQVDPLAGLAVAADDPRALADAILRLANSDLTAMGMAARALAERQAAAHLEGYRRLLDSMIANEGAPAAAGLAAVSR